MIYLQTNLLTHWCNKSTCTLDNSRTYQFTYCKVLKSDTGIQQLSNPNLCYILGEYLCKVSSLQTEWLQTGLLLKCLITTATTATAVMHKQAYCVTTNKMAD